MCARGVQALFAAAFVACASAAFAQAPALEVKGAFELPVWKTIVVGSHRGVDAVRDALDRERIVIGDSADEILGRPAFTFAAERRALNLVLRSVAELGFGERGATLADIHSRAVRLGFELCPEEVGPQLRLQYRNQPVGEFLHLAMKPQRTYDGELTDFTLANTGAGLTLLGGSAKPDLVLAGNVTFVFVRPSVSVVGSREP